MPFAQSMELPPPRPTKPSRPREAAACRPASTIAEVGFSPKPSKTVEVTPASERLRHACST